MGRDGASQKRQYPTGMRMARSGNGALTTPLTCGIGGGDQCQEVHEWSRGIDVAEVSEFRHQGDGHGTRHPAQGLKCLEPSVQAPGFGLLVECVLSTLETCRMCIDGADVCLEDEVWRGGGPDHVGEPPEVSLAPRGPTRLAKIVSEEDSVEPARRAFESTNGIFTRPGEVAHGCLFGRGAIDRGELPCAHESSPLHSVPAVG
jgi:hypothetical protein